MKLPAGFLALQHSGARMPPACSRRNTTMDFIAGTVIATLLLLVANMVFEHGRRS